MKVKLMELSIHALRTFRNFVKQITIKYGSLQSKDLGKEMYKVTQIQDTLGIKSSSYRNENFYILKRM